MTAASVVFRNLIILGNIVCYRIILTKSTAILIKAFCCWAPNLGEIIYFNVTKQNKNKH